MSCSEIDLSKSAFVRLARRKTLACLEIRHPAFRADILLQGAQLLHFSPMGEDNWLWLSETADYLPGVSVRGGIPVCWPWFGNADRNPAAVQSTMVSGAALPAHGFARTVEWQLHDLYEAADRIELTLGFSPEDRYAHLWQGKADVKARWTFSRCGMQMELITRNLGATPLPFSQALHTYFPTADIHQTRLQGLNGCEYIDTLQGWQRLQQQGDVRFVAETDRICFAPSAQPLTLISPQRRFTLRAENSHSCVVWNPWIAKSRRLGQFQPSAWQTMFCVETANAADDHVMLDVGGSHIMSLHLSRS